LIDLQQLDWSWTKMSRFVILGRLSKSCSFGGEGTDRAGDEEEGFGL